MTITALFLLLTAQQAVPRVGVGVIETKLTLREAVEMALASNLDLEVERTNRASARESLKGAFGAYDPVFHWQPSVDSRAQPTGSPLAGVNGKVSEKALGQNFSLRGKTPWSGLSLGADFENGRLSTNNPFAGLNPYSNSRLILSATQPLFRNRLIDHDRQELRLRRKQIDLSDADYRLRVIDVVTRVELAYWDLSAARQDAVVTFEAVSLAREQYARNERMIASGTMAPIELSASRAELERRLDGYYASTGLVTEFENNLKQLLSPSRQNEIWSQVIVPTDVKGMVTTPELPDVREAVATALQNRPEMQQIGVRKETNQFEQQFAADQSKPVVNLVGSYINAGLAGSLSSSTNPFGASNAVLFDRVNKLSASAGLSPLESVSFGSVPSSLIGGYGTALGAVFGGSYQSASIGLSLDLTLRNRAAQSLAAQTAIAGKRLDFEQRRAEQTIEAQVRSGLQAIQTARQRIVAAEASEAAAKEKLESETRLFQSGESTNFFVLTRQNEYLDARRRVLVAQLELNKAAARLALAHGGTIERHAIKIN